MTFYEAFCTICLYFGTDFFEKMQILIVKTTSLGDVIQSFPVIARLKREFPKAQIDWAVEKPFGELLRAHPDIRTVIPLEIREWKKKLFQSRAAIRKSIHALRAVHYDLLIDLQGNIKSGLITRFVKAKEKIGTTFRAAPEWPNAFFLTHRYPQNKQDPIILQYLSLIENHFHLKPLASPLPIALNISLEEKRWIQSELVSGTKVMVCPGANWENKKLSLSTWVQYLKKLSGETHFYFVWGTEKERQEGLSLQAQFPNRSTLLPRMTLPVWQQFMSHMDHIFTVDSSALHLAATTTVPTTSFFGPSSSSIYKPPGSHHQAIQGSCPYGKSFTKRCPILRTCKTGACIKNISL